jgi:hypothetical protein
MRPTTAQAGIRHHALESANVVTRAAGTILDWHWQAGAGKNPVVPPYLIDVNANESTDGLVRL